jgi:acyl carrier protein
MESAIDLLSIKGFIVSYISRTLNIPEVSIKVDVPVDTEYGMESMDVLSLAAEIEDWLEVDLEIDLFFRYRSVEALAGKVFELTFQR